MVTVNVNDVKWRIPERLTIKEWVALQKWDFAQPLHYPFIINTLSGISLSDLQAAGEEQVTLFMGFIIAAMNKRTPKWYPEYEHLKFGEFVDLDCYLALGVENHIDAILETLEVDTPFADEALAVIEDFIVWRNRVYADYTGLFGDGEGGDPDAAPINPTEVSRGWYNIIVELAGDDVLKMDEVTEEPLRKILTFLQIRKEKAEKEAQEARKIRLRQ